MRRNLAGSPENALPENLFDIFHFKLISNTPLIELIIKICEIFGSCYVANPIFAYEGRTYTIDSYDKGFSTKFESDIANIRIILIFDSGRHALYVKDEIDLALLKVIS